MFPITFDTAALNIKVLDCTVFVHITSPGLLHRGIFAVRHMYTAVGLAIGDQRRLTGSSGTLVALTHNALYICIAHYAFTLLYFTRSLYCTLLGNVCGTVVSCRQCHSPTEQTD